MREMSHRASGDDGYSTNIQYWISAIKRHIGTNIQIQIFYGTLCGGMVGVLCKPILVFSLVQAEQ